MSVELLDKTRRINRLLQEKLDSNRVIFNDLCEILGVELEASVYVISRKGKLLGVYSSDKQPVLSKLITEEVGKMIDNALNNRLLNVLSTKENVNLETLGFSSEEARNLSAIIAPILISGQRLGHLFIYRKERFFSIDDIIISEFGTTVIGLETMRAEKEEIDMENSRKSTVMAAINALSDSELAAIKTVIRQLDGGEGILVASKIADNIGITRSIIVNALRKLESAGIIESRSSGMKGTFIKIVNDYLYEILEDEED